MKLMTISEVTKTFNVTARMLRYYDEIGLLPSTRKQDYAYRVYDEYALKRLQQIIALRKLRIPLKKIALIFNDIEQTKIIEIFQESIDEINTEITALQTIRDILNTFVTRLNSMADMHIKLDMLNDADIISVIQTLSLSKIKLKEESSMDDLNKANEILSTLKNVRIIYLPPFTVAASHYFGENPEENALKPLDEFVRSIELKKIKPDLRMFGFNNPSPSGNETYGYEFWVTIPDDLDVPSSLQKKYFKGGLYAAHCIKMGDFHEWQLLVQWVTNSSEYEYDTREPFGMDGCLEEHINAYSYFAGDEKAAQFIQLDLLIPIKVK
ncbi:MerR family transcriptional regulator [Defluviitalea raffinosedens]|uniref:MerR family transcriptional regulator n=1 Tax=Defluviitalea raffinosedens TaxID=1450156 RepID=A0A7C8LF77_9FIRM|nr:effector binding domain-containing protein [Defluviitalea raffinosedens]KAE9628370.1 MerR family transcriptional regulator [Defluviitalea raffinosedens]